MHVASSSFSSCVPKLVARVVVLIPLSLSVALVFVFFVLYLLLLSGTMRECMELLQAIPTAPIVYVCIYEA